MAAAEPLIGPSPASWQGALALRFAAAGARTVVATRRHEGPFCIQRPFYPDDGVCHVYLLHPPGGLAAGDRLTLQAAVDAGAATLLTTPAATKFYKSDNAPSMQSQSLSVAGNATLEWLPLDTILFGGSRAEVRTDVELHEQARFFGWELITLGRPLSGDDYLGARFDQRTRICVAGEPLLTERLRWRSGETMLDADWGLATFRVCGALYAYPADDTLLAATREHLRTAAPLERAGERTAGTPPGTRVGAPGSAGRYAATLLGRLLVVRGLAAAPESLRNTFTGLWSALRADVVGHRACPPRIWQT